MFARSKNIKRNGTTGAHCSCFDKKIQYIFCNIKEFSMVSLILLRFIFRDMRPHCIWHCSMHPSANQRYKTSIKCNSISFLNWTACNPSFNRKKCTKHTRLAFIFHFDMLFLYFMCFEGIWPVNATRLVRSFAVNFMAQYVQSEMLTWSLVERKGQLK